MGKSSVSTGLLVACAILLLGLGRGSPASQDPPSGSSWSEKVVADDAPAEGGVHAEEEPPEATTESEPDDGEARTTPASRSPVDLARYFVSTKELHSV